MLYREVVLSRGGAVQRGGGAVQKGGAVQGCCPGGGDGAVQWRGGCYP